MRGLGLRLLVLATALVAVMVPAAAQDFATKAKFAVLMDYEIAQQAYVAALQAAESVRRQSINDRKYVVAYIPPREPEQSNWWSRLGNVFAVLIGSALLWGVGALIYSIIRDHME